MWSAAILAGGQARRFGGADKGALLVEGRTILARQLDTLTAVANEILLVGGRDVPDDVRVQSIADRVPGCGPLGGLHAALSESHGSATVIVACDMPYLSAPFLRHLLSLTDDADAVVPFTERGYHPLCAAYTRACLVPAAARLADRRFKMTELFQDLRVRAVTIREIETFGAPERLLANVNTPADYSGLEVFHGHQP
jgi:molybdopterin-guanine dinucleotide biosynthesis protein A